MKNVDFRNGRPLVMMVSQYDFGYNLQVALWSNGTPVTITAAEIVSENFTAACTFTGNVVTIPVTTSMTEQFGHFPAELRVTDSTGQVSSKNFDWFVERSPLAVKSTETYSGDIVEFTAKRVPLSSVVVTMEPIQDLNGYSSPWPAGGGKNLLDAALLKDQAGWNIIPLKVKPDTIYTMSTDKPNDDLYLYFKNTNIAGGGSSDVVYAGHPVTVTSTSDGYVYVPQRRASGTDSFQNYHYQIEEGSTETDYTPYSNICPITGRTGASVLVNSEYSETGATTYPITFTSAGTVYAGTVDLVSGVLTVTHGSITIDGSMSIRLEGTRFYVGKDDCKRLPLYTTDSIRCDRLPTVADETQIKFNSAGITAYKQSSSYVGRNWIYFSSGDESITTTAQMQSWLADNPLQVVYELVDPITYTLTPTQVMSLLGENVVWSPDGEVTVVVPEFYS